MSQIVIPEPGRSGRTLSGNAVTSSTGPAAGPADVFSADAASVIARSHQRSTTYGLSTDTRPDFSPVGRGDMELLIEQNRMLHSYAMPVMETLYDQIANTHSMVVLTDAQGLIVHSLGDDDFMQKADRVALRPGVAWSEQSKGTNAIGTAIAEKAPVLVHASQHYLKVNHFLVCSAAPIFDHEGKVAGVLDVSSEQHHHHSHTMALVRMSAQMIENQLFTASFQEAITMHFHSRPEFIGTLMEGIACFSPGGRFLSANRSGLFQLGLPYAALRTHTLYSLFGLSVSALFDHCRTAGAGLLDMCSHSGVRVYARADLRLPNTLLFPACEVNNRSGQTQLASRLNGLHPIDTGDPAVSAAIVKIRKVMGRDIPILITGETGTGKEWLARAIHEDSPRAHAPFMALNCGTVPENLIESEWFGHMDGALAGPRRKGSIGKIQQASGGTLFLDEIGDMPRGLQPRLLQVLREQVIRPIGSNKTVPVNVVLICASRRNLRDLIDAGLFQEDLYYQLNGLVVRLPPLRERSDLDALIARILAMQTGTRPYTLSAEVMQLLRAHPWPGNVRQLASLLRTASLLAGEACQIRREHLPDDFLEDIGRAAVPQSGEPATRLHDVERSLIERTLQAHHGNVSATAKSLGISRNTIYRRLSST